MLNRVRQPFNLSTLSLATAEAAVRDQDYVAFCREQNSKWRAYLVEELAAVGIPCDPSHTNFVLARLQTKPRPKPATRTCKRRG